MQRTFSVHLLENFSSGFPPELLGNPIPNTPFNISFIAPAAIVLVTVLALLGITEVPFNLAYFAYYCLGILFGSTTFSFSSSTTQPYFPYSLPPNLVRRCCELACIDKSGHSRVHIDCRIFLGFDPKFDSAGIRTRRWECFSTQFLSNTCFKLYLEQILDFCKVSK